MAPGEDTLLQRAPSQRPYGLLCEVYTRGDPSNLISAFYTIELPVKIDIGPDLGIWSNGYARATEVPEEKR
jgi:hypothetical protein